MLVAVVWEGHSRHLQKQQGTKYNLLLRTRKLARLAQSRVQRNHGKGRGKPSGRLLRSATSLVTVPILILFSSPGCRTSSCRLKSSFSKRRAALNMLLILRASPYGPWPLGNTWRHATHLKIGTSRNDGVGMVERLLYTNSPLVSLDCLGITRENLVQPSPSPSCP